MILYMDIIIEHCKNMYYYLIVITYSLLLDNNRSHNSH